MKIVKKIKDKGYPVNQKKYRIAHALASKAEKRKYGKKQYEQLRKISEKHPKELLGSYTKKGEIKVSSIVPKRLRKNVIFHETVEKKYIK